MAIAGVVFLLVEVSTGFGLVRYRASSRSTASQSTEHHRVEAVYAVVLLAIAIAIVVVTRTGMARDNKAPAASDVQIVVTGFQWCWRFHYGDPAVTVTGDCLGGHDPTLVVPAGRPVHIETTSTDVIHSFWVPAFRYKMDAFPHHINSFVMTVPKVGEWKGHCAEFCGEDHAFMTFTLKSVSPTAYNRWIHAQAATEAPAS